MALLVAMVLLLLLPVMAVMDRSSSVTRTVASSSSANSLIKNPVFHFAAGLHHEIQQTQSLSVSMVFTMFFFPFFGLKVSPGSR